MSNNETLFKCAECGLHYKDQKISRQCQAFCKKYKACSMEITQQSEEYLESASRRAEEQLS